MQNALKIFLFAAFMLVIVAGLTACATTAEPVDAPVAANPRSPAVPVEQMAAPVREIEYVCNQGRLVHITLQGPKRADLNVSGARTALSAVRTASGAKFESADGSITFWSQGNEAQLQTSDGVKWQCRLVEQP